MNQLLKSLGVLMIICLTTLIACKGKGTTESDTTAADTTKVAPNPADLDPSKVSSGQYKVLADTLGLRMLEVNYAPGDSSAMHWHPDHIAYALGPCQGEFRLENGTVIPLNIAAGQVMFAPQGSHSAKNTGTTPLRAILTEIHRQGAISAPDPATDVLKIAKNMNALMLDTAGVRVIEVTIKPGQQMAMHNHPVSSLYILEGGKAEFTDGDGKKTVNEMAAGSALINPAHSHKVKNVGTTTLRAILVEVNRAE